MKTVFNNAMVIHVWAQQTQQLGSNSGETLFFNGPVLNSYSTSIALHYGDMVLTADPSQFSQTTNRHTPSDYDVSPARRIVLPAFFNWNKRYYSKYSFPKGGEIKRALLDEILKLCKSYKGRRTDSTRATDALDIEDRRKELKFICNRFGLVCPPGYGSVEEILDLSESKIQALKKAEEKERKKAAREKKKRQEEEKARLEEWLAGETQDFPHSYYSGKMLLTVRGDMVQTSRGAEAPVEHVKKAFKLYDVVMKTGVPWEKNGDRCRLGCFDLDWIDVKGNAGAGCHRFEVEEINRFRAKWGF